MKRMLTISALVMATAFSTTALADRNDAVVGAVVGGGAGALIGHSIKGRDGAMMGGALGAITGVALATSDRGREPVVVHQQTVVRERVVYEPQRVVVVKRYEPRRVVVVERRFEGRGNNGHHHGWKNAYAYHDRDHDRDRGYSRDRDDCDEDRGGRWH